MSGIQLFSLEQRKKYLQYADDARSDMRYFQHIGNQQAAERQRDLAAYFEAMANTRSECGFIFPNGTPCRYSPKANVHAKGSRSRVAHPFGANSAYRCPRCESPDGQHDNTGAMEKCYWCGWHSEAAKKRSNEILKANGYKLE